MPLEGETPIAGTMPPEQQLPSYEGQFLSLPQWVDSTNELAVASWHATSDLHQRNPRACRSGGDDQLCQWCSRQVRTAFSGAGGNPAANGITAGNRED